MNALRFLLTAAIVLFAPLSASALTMGFNADIHNGTGQDAYDFHVEGVLKSSKPPVQLADFSYSNVPGFDWQYDGGAITPLGGNEYKYEGSWSGATPVPPSSVVHFGKYWDEECHNIFVEVRGWWTGQNGERLVPQAGTAFGNEAPLVGFDVQDRLLTPGAGAPQTVRLTNDTAIALEVRNVEFAITPEDVPLEELVASSNQLGLLDWVPARTDAFVIDQTAHEMINLNQLGLFVPPDTTLVTRMEVFDPTNQQWYFSAHRHTSHVPEPLTIVVAATGLVGVALRGRRVR